MTADPRVEAVAAVLRRDGWTCDYHEPVDDPGECPDCDEGHASTAGRIVAALDAYAEGSDLALMVQRERIAQAIDAEAFDRAHAVHDPQCADCAAIAALTLAARIARGQS